MFSVGNFKSKMKRVSLLPNVAVYLQDSLDKFDKRIQSKIRELDAESYYRELRNAETQTDHNNDSDEVDRISQQHPMHVSLQLEIPIRNSKKELIKYSDVEDIESNIAEIQGHLYLIIINVSSNSTDVIR